MDESSCDEGEEVHAYRGQELYCSEEEVALSRAITSEPIASSGSSCISVDRLVVSANVSADAVEDKDSLKVSSKW